MRILCLILIFCWIDLCLALPIAIGCLAMLPKPLSLIDITLVATITVIFIKILTWPWFSASCDAIKANRRRI